MSGTGNSPPALYSGAWFRSPTDEQLRELADGNMPGGRAYDGAMAELAQRAADRQGQEQMRWTKRTFWAALILGLTGAAATLGVALVD